MAARFKVCIHQSYKKDPKGDTDMQDVYCKKRETACIAKKYCPELNKIVVSENAKSYCCDFESVFN